MLSWVNVLQQSLSSVAAVVRCSWHSHYLCYNKTRAASPGEVPFIHCFKNLFFFSCQECRYNLWCNAMYTSTLTKWDLDLNNSRANCPNSTRALIWLRGNLGSYKGIHQIRILSLDLRLSSATTRIAFIHSPDLPPWEPFSNSYLMQCVHSYEG